MPVEFSQRNVNGKLFCLAQGALLVLMALSAGVSAILDIPSAMLLYPLCVLTLALFIWVLWSWTRVTGSFLGPYVIFVIAVFLFNTGQSLLEVFDLNPRGLLNNAFVPETLVQAVFLTAVGISAFHFGALLAAGRAAPLLSERPAQWLLEECSATRLVGWSLLAISVVPEIVTVSESMTAVMAHGYFVGLFQREPPISISAVPFILSNCFVPGALFLMAGNDGRRRPWNVLPPALIVVHAALYFFIGIRAPATAALAAYAWLHHRRISKLPLLRAVVLASVMLVFVLPLVRAVRDISGEDRSTVQSVADGWQRVDNPLVSILSEMGGTLAVTAYTIDLLPAVRNFAYGESYLTAALSVIPNLSGSGSLHPTVSHGTPAAWLMDTVDTSRAAVGGGLGYSLIAEAYFNFGWFFSPVALALLGFLYARLVFWAADRGGPAEAALIASFMLFFLIYSRGESASIVRGVCWYAAVPYLCVRLLRPMHRLKSRRGGSVVPIIQ